MLVFSVFTLNAQAQKSKKKKNASTEMQDAISKLSLNTFKYRSIGPALTSGRIADFAVNPDNISEFYVAAAAGGVWKTTNAGITFKPIFDNEGSYSIGCITMDPNNHNVIWVGTGENNNQRSVSFGDGVYKSEDGGDSWKNVGLKSSEHIGMITIDPNNSDIVYVAAYGPVWSVGGERGIYKTIDGGVNWERILHVSDMTGFNEIHMDPRDNKVLYATAHQRIRKQWTYLGGGPESGIYKSTDGGTSWNKINRGLPSGDKGRIGMAISPANPEIIYAVVEAQEGKGGFYKSTNRGASWQKMNNVSTSGNYSGYLSFFTRLSGSTPSERMRINSSGNVGIGNTDPGEKLSVSGADSGTTISSSGVTLNIGNTDTTANNIASISFGNSGSGNSWSRLGVVYTNRTGGAESQGVHQLGGIH